MADGALLRREFDAMGTLVSLSVWLDDQARQHDAQLALARAQALVEQFGFDGWAYGEGALGKFNARLATGARAEIPPTLHALFTRAWQLHELTAGLYEPRCAALVRPWGFGDMARGVPPDADEIAGALEALRSAPAWDGGASYGPAPGTGWDLGGIGKGWIADAVLAQLREAGFANALFDAGGNVSVRGGRGGRPWRIGIRDPRDPELRPLAALDAGDESVNTHGDDQRYFEHGNVRYSHLIDPRTGSPAQGLRSITVVHADGAFAEAAGLALFIAGPSGWRALAERIGAAQVLALGSDETWQLTPALEARLARP